MKRYKNLYQNICNIKNIQDAYKEVCKNTRNKGRVEHLLEYKSIYISRVYNILINKEYVVGPYHQFIIYEPKKRTITSQNMQDKIVNHLVARHILYPAILPCLLDVNVASRKDLGTSAGLKIAENFRRKCKIKYGHYYVLKCDISKFFYSIDHDNLKSKLTRRIKDKEYLKYCLAEITKFLEKEHLVLNRKTRIYKNTNNFLFLGRNSKGRYSRYRNVKRKLRSRFSQYANGNLPLNSFISSYICYQGLCERQFKINRHK